MDFGLNKFIIAVVTTNRDAVSPGSMTPVFYAKDEKHLEELSLSVSKVVGGLIHDVGEGLHIIVRH